MNHAEFERGRDRVHDTASANSAWSGIAQHPACEFAAHGLNLENGPGHCAHADADPPALKCGTCGSGGAQQAVPVADDDLAICAQINEPGKGFAFVKTCRQNAGKDVAAGESTEARQKPHGRVSNQLPA